MTGPLVTPPSPTHPHRYRFGEFVLSPRRRVLARAGRPQPLIPRYFDLLVFLVERRAEAVHRRDIFDRVWTDVIVSDSALSQAIRTIRRVLGDDSREPVYVRTVSRHGYQFVFAEILEEADDGDWPGADTPLPAPSPRPLAAAVAGSGPATDPFPALLVEVAHAATSEGAREAQRDAAERLHVLGTAEALRRLGDDPRHAFARALLRDTRWDAAEAGPVPIIGAPHAAAVAWHLVRLRLTRAAGIAATRWAAAAIGSGAAGVFGGAIGGLLLALAPGSAAPLAVVPVLAVIGGAAGAISGAGVGAGLAVAEAAMRSRRALALTTGAALGGALVGGLVQWLARAALSVLVGVDLAVGGGLEGLIIGGAAGAGYALATTGASGGLAAPRGRGRVRVVAAIAVACGLAALALALLDRPLVGGTVHAVALASRGATAALTPLGRIIGEPDFGPVTAALISLGEGATFGLGLAFGVTRRS